MKYILNAYWHILGYWLKLWIIVIYYTFMIIGLVLEFLWDLKLPNDVKKRFTIVKMKEYFYPCTILVIMGFPITMGLFEGFNRHLFFDSGIMRFILCIFYIGNTLLKGIEIEIDGLKEIISLKEFFLMPNHKSNEQND